jgi:excisionase family DNA binding protein
MQTALTEPEVNRQEPLLLRIHPDATRLTNLGRTTLYAEIASGRLRAIKFGRAVRIRRDDLDAWIERHTVEALESGA